jgi:SAM-dependent methyltransferase
LSTSRGTEVRLNVGAGETYIPGFHNIDISPDADITIDLNREQLPFEDDSVDLVFSYHTLEHVQEYLFALGEIHRVLRPGGRFLLGVPYVTLTEYHLVNPYHLHNFNEHSFSFFDPDRLKGSAGERNPIQFKKIFHRFHYMGMFHLVPPPLRGWCRRHLLNVVRKIDFGLVKIDPEAPLLIEGALGDAMRREFQDLLRSRQPYRRQDRVARLSRIPGRRALKAAWSWWNGHG